jgi:chain length determinant protein EpsF
MNLSQFFSILKARWWVAATVFLLTVGIAVGITLVLPKKYTASATLIVDQMRPDPVAAVNYSGNPSPAFMATQVDVLKSERVARRVVGKLKLDEDPSAHEEWMRATKGAGTLTDWVVAEVGQALEVKPSRESNVITVSYKASSPKQAAKVANAFVQAYMDVSLELKVDPARQYSSFFDSRSKELRSNLERAQTKLSAYQREKGVIIASDGQFDGEVARLNELSSQLIALQAVTAESNSRHAQAQAAGDRVQEVFNNPNISALRGDLTRAEARLNELSSRLGDNHPQVIEAKATISSLRSRLDAETRRVTGSLGVSSAINRQREVEIRAALEAQRARVMRMRTAREEGAVLLRDVENAQRAYDAVVARLNQSSLESQTTQGGASLLAEAVPPLLPSSPKVVLNGILALGLGIVLGLGAVALLEIADRRVRTVEEVSDLLGLPIFGVLPKPGGMSGFAGGRKLLVSPRGLFGRLPAPGKEA